MDVLSNVLNVTNLATHVFGAREFRAPWAIGMAASDHAAVHIVRRGMCWLLREGAAPLRLASGDVVLLATGVPHALSSHREPRAIEPYQQAIARSQAGVVPPLDGVVDATHEPTCLLCAGYEFSKHAPHPLFCALLPPVIHGPAEEAESDGDLQLLLRLLSSEAHRRAAGAELVLPRLIDTLFVYMLRSWLHRQPEGGGGWLGALRDPQISKALALIHDRPHHAWTVEMLARAVALSRAAFAKRFTDLVGESPLAYVTRWRMDLAAKLLRESREPLARIAQRSGYVSETAFAKAFRRRFACSPGEYRFAQRQTADDRNVRLDVGGSALSPASTPDDGAASALSN
jgi:AraC-like DNA-binding protein